MAVTLKPKPNHPTENIKKSQNHIRLNVKDFQTLFFDCNVVMHHEFLPQGRTVNKEYYLEVISRLHEEISQKRTELWKNQS